MNLVYRRQIKLQKFELGKIYQVRFFDKEYICRFIQVTKTGFNLLILDTDVCLFYRLLYVDKKKSTETSKYYYINWDFKIEKVIQE